MNVVSRRISLTAWGHLCGFDKATTARMHHAGKLPEEFQVEQLPNGRCKDDLDRQVGRVVEWATQQGCRPDEVVKEIGSGLNGNRRRLRRLVADHTVGTIVVEHQERLCRFGFEYVEAARQLRAHIRPKLGESLAVACFTTGLMHRPAIPAFPSRKGQARCSGDRRLAELLVREGGQY